MNTVLIFITISSLLSFHFRISSDLPLRATSTVSETDAENKYFHNTAFLYSDNYSSLAFSSDINPNEKPDFQLIDKHATAETKAMHARLKELTKRGIMFAHQDDLAYGHAWYGDDGRSDVRDVCGDYPAVVGWELGHVEIASEYNLDSIYFTDMKRYIFQTHRRGGFNTISWHADNILTGNTAWDCKQTTVVKSILPGGDKHSEYKIWLDRLASFFADLKDEYGKPIPVIFRMYHEHTGDWFWWCSAQCTPQEYIALWKMTIEYLRDTKQIHNLIYAYSPSDVGSRQEYLERYPGDDFVDILGFDCYAAIDRMDWYKQRMKLNLDIMTDYAMTANKIACLSETGLEGVKDTAYFSETLFPLIENYALSYVLVWRNAWQIKTHYYAPFPGHPAADDFRRFTQFNRIIMCKDLSAIINRKR